MKRALFGYATALALLAGGPAAADDLSVPVVAFEAGREVDSGAMDAVVLALGSPAARGQALRDAMGLIAPPGSEVARGVSDRFREAQDAFFAGRHDAAAEAFVAMDREVTGGPAILAVAPELRASLFKAHLYLALIAAGNGAEGDASAALAAAASRFPELEPSPAEFPPWIVERIAALRQASLSAGAEVQVEGASACSLVLDGRELGPPSRTYSGVALGEHVAEVRCGRRTSPAQRLVVTGEEERFTPLVLSHGSAVPTGADLVVAADAGASPQDIVEDALAVARAVRAGRLVAVVFGPQTVEVLLVDAARGDVLRSGVAQRTDEASLRSATASILGPAAAEDAASPAAARTRPWYRDPLAWSLVAGGAAALAAGIALGQVYGTPSAEEPAAYAMTALGGGCMATGVVLFFVPWVGPPSAAVPGETAFGAAVVRRF